MKPRRPLDDALVGLFVVAALVVLVIGTLWLAGRPMFGGTRVTYQVVMNDAGGLRTGDEVRSAGVPVGRITGLELRPGNDWPVLLRISLDPDIDLRADARARQTTAGIMGAPFLQIDPGREVALFPLTGEIPGTAGQDIAAALARVDELSVKVMGLVDQAAALMAEITTQTGPLLDKVGALVSDENAAHVTSILAQVHQTLASTAPRLEGILDRLEQVATDVDEGMDDLPEIMASVQRLTEDLESALGPDGQRLAKLLETTEEGMAAARDALGTVNGSGDEVEKLIRDLQLTMANLKAFSQEVKERPYSLVRIKNEPDRQPGDGIKKEAP
jgi:phospholipid/cholesterol/gamma-HCH transport system substrate-binding protein